MLSVNNSNENADLASRHQVHAANVSSPPDRLLQSSMHVIVSLQHLNITQQVLMLPVGSSHLDDGIS